MPLDRKIQSGPPACSIEILFPSGKIICHQFNTPTPILSGQSGVKSVAGIDL
jgi:hypothetical protein